MAVCMCMCGGMGGGLWVWVSVWGSMGVVGCAAMAELAPRPGLNSVPRLAVHISRGHLECANSVCFGTFPGFLNFWSDVPKFGSGGGGWGGYVYTL